jgi:hypothetical protein
MFEELQSSLSLDYRGFVKGANRSADAADEVGDEAADSTGQVARLGAAMRAVPNTLKIDVKRDGLSFRRLAGRVTDLGSTFRDLRSVLQTGTIPAIAALAGAAGGAVFPLAGLAGAAGGVGAAFAGGIFADANTEEKLKTIKKSANKAIRPLRTFSEMSFDTLRGGVSFLGDLADMLAAIDEPIKRVVDSWGETFTGEKTDIIKSLRDLIVTFLPALEDFGNFLIKSVAPGLRFITKEGRKSLPALRDLGSAIVDSLGPLGRFVGLVFREVGPALADLIRWATRAGGVLVDVLGPAVGDLIGVGRKAKKPINAIWKALVAFGRKAKPAVKFAGKLGGALFDLASAAVGVGDLNDALDRVSRLVRKGIGGAWQWVRTKGVTLGKKAFKLLVRAVLGAWDFTKKEVLPPVTKALGKVWSWLRQNGVSLGKKALGFLVDQALTAWDFVKTDVLPPVSSALGDVWSWLRTKGVTLAKKALGVLVTQALTAWDFVKKDFLPAVSGALGDVWSWVRTKGVTLAIQAFDFLVQRLVESWEFTKEKILPKVKTALEGVWQWVRNEGVTLGKQALSFLATQAATALDTFKQDILPKIKTGIDGVVTWIKNPGLSLFQEGFRTIGRNIGPAIVFIMDTVVELFRRGIPRIRDFLANNGVSIVKAGFKAIGTGIRQLILTMFAIGGAIGSAVKSTLQGIADWYSSGGKEQLKQSFIDIVTGIVSYFKNQAYSDLKGAAEFLFDAIIAAAEGLYKGLIGESLIPEMMNDIADFIRTFDLASAAKTLLDTVVTKFEDFVSSIIGNEDSIVKSLISDIKSYIETGAKSDIKGAFETLGSAISEAMGNAADAAITSFNETMPDSISVPEVTFGGGGINLPSTTIAGQQVGGGVLRIPQATVGGQSLQIPQLDTGGLIEEAGLAMLHAGEQVVPAADVDRSGGGEGGTTVTFERNSIVINADSDADGRELGREFADELSAELNTSL